MRGRCLCCFYCCFRRVVGGLVQRVAGEDVISGRRADGADDVLRPQEAIGGDLLLRLNRVAGVEK